MCNIGDDVDDKDDTKRRTRNLSEKKRRDQFNRLVGELSSLITTNNRKMDKTTVLKSTISFLRNHNEVTVRSRANDVQEDWKPSFLSNDEFTYLVLEALEGFLMVFSSTGKILYVSDGIGSLLGLNPADIINNNLFELTYEKDRPCLYNILQKYVAESEQNPAASKDPEMVNFDLHLKRGSHEQSEEPTFERITFHGHFRTNSEMLDDRHELTQQELESRTTFVCTGRLPVPKLIRDVSLLDLTQNEFISRHSLEWKFLFLDHRAPPIIGYLPFEVLGTSGYDYYHFDDLENVVSCHESLMQNGETTSCCYRFLTKGQQWIWLMTRYYITYHQWNAKPEFVVCTHRVVECPYFVSTKEENMDTNPPSSDSNTDVKLSPSDEQPHSTLSPSYMSDGSDAFGSYNGQSQSDGERLVIKQSLSDDQGMASPSYLSETSDAYSYRPPSQLDSRQLLKDTHSDSEAMAGLSPSYMSVSSEPYNSSRLRSKARSSKAASVSGAMSTEALGDGMWMRHRHASSDSGSVAGYVRSGGRREKKRLSGYERGINPAGFKRSEPALVPQHSIGAQFLDPTPYVGVSTVMPMPTLPTLPSVPTVIVGPDQAQMQEQLHRKHEELQQMIMRQQEELKQVKEQLLLARFGILQPIINVPYPTPEPMQQQTNGYPRQTLYENDTRGMTYPPAHPPHLYHPHHAPGSHHHMSQ